MMSARSVARDLHMVAPGRLSARVGESSRRSEEIVKISNCASMRSLLFSLLLQTVRAMLWLSTVCDW